MKIIWKQTKLGIWYPTLNGRDVFMELWQREGLGFGEDCPVFEDYDEAIRWSKKRGYNV